MCVGDSKARGKTETQCCEHENVWRNGVKRPGFFKHYIPKMGSPWHLLRLCHLFVVGQANALYTITKVVFFFFLNIACSVGFGHLFIHKLYFRSLKTSLLQNSLYVKMLRNSVFGFWLLFFFWKTWVRVISPPAGLLFTVLEGIFLYSFIVSCYHN